MAFTRIFISLIFSLLLLCGSSASAHASKKRESLLILHSYSRDSVWTDILDRSIKKEFDKLGHHFSFYTEYMDSKRFFNKEYQLKFTNLLKTKYSDKELKLIITTDDNAFNFVMAHRRTIFKNPPLIFTGVNGYGEEEKKKYQSEKNFSGLVEKFKIKETVEMGLKLHPKAKKIYVINTKHTTSGIALKKSFEKAFNQLNLEQEVIYLEDYNIKDLYLKVSLLEKDSFAIFGAYSRDKSGTFLNFEKNLKEIAKQSSIPIYGFLEYYLPYGLTGGYFTSGKVYGREAARLAVKYLDGTDFKDIPIVEDVESPILFEYNMLNRFDIDISKIPADARIINQNSRIIDLYNKFTFEFWVVLFSFICLIVSLIVLYYHFEQQKIHKKAILRINEKLEERVEKRTRQLIEQQAKLINSAKLASIGEMASGIAHEINNPLTVIKLSAYRMIQIADNEIVKKSAEKINDTVERISKIIVGLKQLAKEDGILAKDQINIRDSIDDVISICQARFRENEIDFLIDVNNDLKVNGASIQISQVILNLLNNSFDEISVKEGPRWIKLEGKKSDDFIEISVTDSGKGISEEIYDKIMEPFFTTKIDRRGTGLGLSICKNIIEHHRGRLFVDRESPNTKFVIQLPVG